MKIQELNPFISVKELFGFLFPGSVASVLFLYAFPQLKGEMVEGLTFGSEINSFLLGLVFLLVSYFLGHVLFQFGSLADSMIYDPLKKILYAQANLKIVKKRRKLLFGGEYKKNLSCFDWSLNRLRQLDNKSFFNEIESIIADAKFFRAIFILSLICLVVYESNKSFHYSQLIFIFFFLSAITFFFLLSNNKLQNAESEKSKAEIVELGDGDGDGESNETESQKVESQKANEPDKSKLFVILVYFLFAIFIMYVISDFVYIKNTERTLFFLKYKYASFIISIIAFCSLYLYIDVRQKACKKLYGHIIFLDRKLWSSQI